MLTKSPIVPSRRDDSIAVGIVEDDPGDRIRNRGVVDGRSVDRHKKRSAQADVRIVGNDVEILIRSGEKIEGIADRQRRNPP